eukprot:c44908_g1_i1 orf=3-170(-)
MLVLQYCCFAESTKIITNLQKRITHCIQHKYTLTSTCTKHISMAITLQTNICTHLR